MAFDNWLFFLVGVLVTALTSAVVFGRQLAIFGERMAGFKEAFEDYKGINAKDLERIDEEVRVMKTIIVRRFGTRQEGRELDV